MGRFVRLGGGLLWSVMLAASLMAPRPAQAQARVSVDRSGPEAAPAPTGVTRADSRIEYRIGSTAVPIVVDGRLDETAWETASVVTLPFEVSPAENGPAGVATECRIAYDTSSLYLGCLAADPDPKAIRAYVVDRDGIDGQDRIVLTLDPFNDQRRAFRFGVSALGVQADEVLSQQGAGDPNQGPMAQPVDPSWDAIWSSAGRITDDGYVIEVAIPFRSLRFPRTDAERPWGMYVTRWRPRSSNVELRSAPWDRSDACLLCQANAVSGFAGISAGANVQLTPTLTATRSAHRAGDGPGPLVTDPATGEVGLDLQWGLTTDLTLNLTANPDFSQVEADVAQLEVNNRFALFFPEKRPFFLEGADFFGTPIRAVFTRTVADPTAGAKVTGKLGDNAWGLLVARDRTNNLIIPGSQSSASALLDGEVTTSVARFRRDVGGTSTVGALLVGRDGAGYHNRVGGFDSFYRPVPSVTLQAQLLRSETEYPAAVASEHDQPTRAFSGSAAQLRAQWGTREWAIFADGRRTDEGFRADAGFVTQAGVVGGSVNLTRHIWGASDRWFSQIRLESGAWRNEDFSGNPINGGMWLGLSYEGPWQTRLGLWPNLFMSEHFAGVTHRGMEQLFFDFGTAPRGAVTLGLNGNLGDGIDFANGGLGSELRLSPTANLRLGRKTEATLQHTYQRLDRDGARVFTAHLSQVRTVYNFSARSFVRAIVQYRRTDRNPMRYTGTVDRRTSALLTQVLYAYKVNPQTVLFVGYGQDDAGRVDANDRRIALDTRGRTLFLKLGYAWRP